MSQKDAKHTAKQAALDKIRRKSNSEISSSFLSEEILKGNKSALSQAITLLESTNPSHAPLAAEIIHNCLPHSGKSFRLGITGVPGVGKSTFIETFGNLLLAKGKKVAVLAIDPSSQKTKGSILGDKTRMQTLISKEDVFIRPSPTSESLGGVARATREAMILCEAAGFDFIIIETVGVGQSETEVSSMVDFFLLLMLSGAGDELQGIKRGIMEMADAVAITKADGENEQPSTKAMAEYKSALHLLPPSDHLFPVEVTTCSALNGKGLPRIYELIEKFIEHTEKNGFQMANRSTQDIHWLNNHLNFRILDKFHRNIEFMNALKSCETEVKEGKISPFSAVDSLLKKFSV